MSPEYQLDFAMKLVEQQQTTDERNQTLLIQTTQRYDETISKLVAKLEQLETTVQTQNAIAGSHHLHLAQALMAAL